MMRWSLTSLIGLCVVATVAAQDGQPRVEVTSPEEGAFVSGPTMLHAVVTTADQPVRRVQFYVDGVLMCTIEGAPFECEWDAGATIDQHQIRAVALLGDGSRLVKTLRTKAVKYDEVVNVDAVLVTAIVTEGEHFVRGLNREQFKVFEDNRPQRLSHFASENIPLEIVIAVDISSSVTSVLPRIKAAVKGFLAALRPQDRVSLLAFNENIFTLARRETDPARRTRALDRLNAWGGTALYDVILKGIGSLDRQQGRRAVVIFTDGNDQSSRNSLQTAQRAVEASDAALFIVILGRPAEVDKGRTIVQQLADVSGGRAFFNDRVEQLQDAFHVITEELSNQYLLAYVPNDASQDDRWRKLRVEVADRRYRVRARQGYRVPARTPAQ